MDLKNVALPEVLPVTVVIPAFNAAAYLGEALASVKAQASLPAEVIVVDDGSTDATSALAIAFGARVIARANGGVAAARNTGVLHAANPWIAFLDADDRWHPQRLMAQWRGLAPWPTARIAATDYSVFGNWREEASAFLRRSPGYRQALSPRIERDAPEVDAVFLRRDRVARALPRGYFLAPSTLLVARDLFVQDGVWFRSPGELPTGEDFHIGEDFEWMLRALRYSDVVVVDRPLVEYRRSATSLSAQNVKMRMGDIVLGELVCRTPALFAAGAAEEFARTRQRQLRRMAWSYLSVGDVDRANAILASAGKERNLCSLGFAALTRPFVGGLGRRIFAVVWNLWRSGARPIVQRLRRAVRLARAAI